MFHHQHQIGDRIDRLLAALWGVRGTDLILTVGLPPMLRVDGSLSPVPGESSLTAEETNALLSEVLTPEQRLLARLGVALDDGRVAHRHGGDGRVPDVPGARRRVPSRPARGVRPILEQGRCQDREERGERGLGDQASTALQKARLLETIWLNGSPRSHSSSVAILAASSDGVIGSSCHSVCE